MTPTHLVRGRVIKQQAEHRVGHLFGLLFDATQAECLRDRSVVETDHGRRCSPEGGQCQVSADRQGVAGTDNGVEGGLVGDQSLRNHGLSLAHDVVGGERSTALNLPGEGVQLPPLYYGTVDATPLWVCLLVDAWKAGLAEEQVRALLPQLDAALRWIVELGDADGDGFLDYRDQTGHGLANQGWKDSGASIQWRDGRIAEGPIALCEVQAYAYEAAIGAAELLDALDPDGSAADSSARPASAAASPRRRRR